MTFMPDFFERYADRIMPEPMSGCWLWIGSATTAGYGNFTRFNQTHYAHRSAFEAANGVELPGDILVRHWCDTPPCVNPGHLLPGSQWDNVQDAIERGRMRSAQGERHASAALSESDVLRARELARQGMPTDRIAAHFPFVGRGAVISAVKGKTWRHLPGAVPNPVKGVPPGGLPGELSALAVLTQNQVNEIRRRLAAGEKGARLAEIFGVSPVTISSIKVRRIWRHA